MTLPPIKLAALIAGGKSRRMGRDKALLDWGGKPLWQHQLDTLACLRPERLVVVAPEAPSWLPPSVEWIKDHRDHDTLGPIGPIGGVLAALEAVPKGLVMALAVDLPGMTPAYLTRLQAGSSESAGMVPHTPKGFEPLAALYSSGAAQSSRKWIHDGHHDFPGWIARLVEQGIARELKVEFSEMALFRNLNTPEDLG